jgi:hypothetical protein
MGHVACTGEIGSVREYIHRPLLKNPKWKKTTLKKTEINGRILQLS